MLEGKEADKDSYNSMKLSEKEVYVRDRGGNEWEQVMKGGYWEASGSKKKKTHKDSLGGTDGEGWEDNAKSPKTGSLEVVVRFEGEGGVKEMEPLQLTKIIRAKVGEVKYVRVQGNGNLLIECDQVEKARKLLCAGKVKVSKIKNWREETQWG